VEEKLELLEQIQAQFGLESVDIRTYSPPALAFLGDAVFEIVIRSVVVGRGNRQPNRLHKEKAQIVNAVTQARMIEALQEELTGEEADIYRRGRNAKFHTAAKNASLTDYRKATGLEALCGYLYLTGRMGRVIELIDRGLDKLNIKI